MLPVASQKRQVLFFDRLTGSKLRARQHRAAHDPVIGLGAGPTLRIKPGFTVKQARLFDVSPR